MLQVTRKLVNLPTMVVAGILLVKTNLILLNSLLSSDSPVSLLGRDALCGLNGLIYLLQIYLYLVFLDENLF